MCVFYQELQDTGHIVKIKLHKNGKIYLGAILLVALNNVISLTKILTRNTLANGYSIKARILLLLVKL